jgi:hypothetical protein
MPQLIGTAPNQVPTNGDLGSAAYMDASAFYGTGVTASFRNKFINGDMRIDQRNAGAAISTLNSGSNEKFAVDRTMIEMGGQTSNTGSCQQVTDGPPGFNKSLKYTAGSSGYNAAGYVAFNQRIEGQNVQDLAFGTSSAQSITLSFWVKSSIPGTYTNNVTHYDGTTERWNNQTYTINVANTWEYKTLTFVGDTVSGPSNNTTGFMRVYWHLGGDAGAATTTSFNTWFNGTGSKRAATTQTNLNGTSGATFFLTGIQLERGTVATPFEHRPFATELQLCHRYCRTVLNGETSGFGFCNGGANFYMFDYGTPMRSTPSLSYSGTINPTNYSSNLSTITGVAAITTTTNSGGVRTAFNLNSSPSAQACGLNPNGNLVLIISEL